MMKTIKVFTGSQVVVNLIKEELEKNGISSLIKNDFNSGMSAGFTVGVPTAIDLFVEGADEDKATTIIADLIKNME